MALTSSSAGRIFIAASPFCVKQKTPPALLPRANKAWPFIRGATLTSWERPHALGGMPTHPWQLTYALRCRILCGRCAAVPCTLSGPFREKRRNAASSFACGGLGFCFSRSSGSSIHLVYPSKHGIMEQRSVIP